MTVLEVATRINDLEAQIVTLNSEAADHAGVISECQSNASRLGKLDCEAFTAAHQGLEKCRISVMGINAALDGLKELQSRARRIDQLKREKQAFIDGLPALMDFKQDIDVFNSKRGSGDRKRDPVFIEAMSRVREFIFLANGMSGRSGELGLRDKFEETLAEMGLRPDAANTLNFNAVMAAR